MTDTTQRDELQEYFEAEKEAVIALTERAEDAEAQLERLRVDYDWAIQQLLGPNGLPRLQTAEAALARVESLCRDVEAEADQVPADSATLRTRDVRAAVDGRIGRDSMGRRVVRD